MESLRISPFLHFAVLLLIVAVTPRMATAFHAAMNEHASRSIGGQAGLGQFGLPPPVQQFGPPQFAASPYGGPPASAQFGPMPQQFGPMPQQFAAPPQQFVPPPPQQFAAPFASMSPGSTHYPALPAGFMGNAGANQLADALGRSAHRSAAQHANQRK
ncbi:protein tfg-1-like [Schistocerca gregaria]|uniref:protein tfg-1-like n=1 Tax=Schistocerca gregaria TaxID=7010 RepID=UPI00211DDF85|nr:protein tfg-1-like [Schistocerca gregaria]